MLPIIALFLITTNCQVESIVLTTDESLSVYSNSQINNDFLIKTDTYDCSAFLYAYSLNQEEFLQNAPSKIVLNNVVGKVQLSISTFYNYLQPQLSQTSC